MIWGWVLISWWMVAWRTSCSRSDFAKPLEFFVLQTSLHAFASQRNNIFMFHMICSVPVLALIADEFWHRCRPHFGNPLASNSMFRCDTVFDVVWIRCLNILMKKYLTRDYRFPHFVDPVSWLVLVPVCSMMIVLNIFLIPFETFDNQNPPLRHPKL